MTTRFFCPICECAVSIKAPRAWEPHPYWQCMNCGFLYQKTLPEKTYVNSHEPPADSMSEADKAANKSIADSLFEKCLGPLPTRPIALDIGSKFPWLSHSLGQRGVQAYAMDAIAELNTNIQTHHLNVTGLLFDFEKTDFDPTQHTWVGNVDLITLIHVIEHFYDPLPTLEKIYQILKPGGFFFIRCPESDVPGIERDFTPGHYEIHPQIWNTKSLQTMIAKLGFEVVLTYPLEPGQRDLLLRKPFSTLSRPVFHSGTSSQTPSEAWLVRPGAAGDVLMTLNLMRLFKEKNPGKKIIYYSQKELHGVLNLSSDISEIRDIAQIESDIAFASQAKTEVTIYNLMGYPLHKGYPETPLSQHLIQSFAEDMGLAGTSLELAQLTPRWDRLSAEFKDKVKDYGAYITLHIDAGWSPYKNWPKERWQQIIEKIHTQFPNLSILQLGTSQSPQLEGCVDLRGTTLLEESIYLIKKAHFHLGVDSFSNHATHLAPKTPALILWGSTSPTGSGYPHNENIWLNPLGCSPCYREYDWQSRHPRGLCPHDVSQSWDSPQAPCLNEVSVEMVWEKAQILLKELF